MNNTRIEVNKIEAYGVTVKVEGNTQEYAMALLHIFNNVRESNLLLHLENYAHNNNITVYCRTNAKDDLVEYLEQFGEITKCELAECIEIDECWLPDYDYDKYDRQFVAIT